MKIKFAIVSQVLPPSDTGQAMVLHRLLSGFDGNDYCLLSRRPYPPSAGPAADLAAGRLPGRYIHLPDERALRPPTRSIVRRPVTFLNMLTAITARSRSIGRVIREIGCQVLVACTGDVLDLPAAFFAARRAGIPFIPYVFDDYANQSPNSSVRLLTTALEPMILRRAAGVIVPNEFLQDDYRARYGLEAALVRNPVDPAAIEHLPDGPAAPPDGCLKILYTGAVYAAHFDAFQNLLAGMERLGPGRSSLDIYTAQPHDWLAENGIRGPVMLHEHVAVSESVRLQRQADLLFLPLAFESPYPRLVRNSAPGKIGEYLCSGKPILVHAPADSYVSWYFRTYDCGMVVDRKDPELIANAIRRLIDDPELAARQRRNARERGEVDFHVSRSRAAFSSLLAAAYAGELQPHKAHGFRTGRVAPL